MALHHHPRSPADPLLFLFFFSRVASRFSISFSFFFNYSKTCAEPPTTVTVVVRALLPPLPYTLVRHRRRRQFNPASLVPRILIDFTARDRGCSRRTLTGLTPGRKRVSYVYRFGLVYVSKFLKKTFFWTLAASGRSKKSNKQIYRQIYRQGLLAFECSLTPMGLTSTLRVCISTTSDMWAIVTYGPWYVLIF